MEKKYTLPINTENLDKLLLTIKNDLQNKIDEFNEKYVTTKSDKYGNVEKISNPLAIATFFFNPINPVPNVEPIYDSEQLSKVWDLYEKMIGQINLQIGTFTPTLSHFCKFSGITLEKMQELKIGSNESMRVLINKINNTIYDSNVMLAQTKVLGTKPTEYRMKYENEALVKKSPNVNVTVNATPLDLKKMNSRISEINRITANIKAYDYEEE